MDPIDRLFLETARIIRIDIRPSASMRDTETIMVCFGARPEPEETAPIMRLLSAPGFSRTPLNGREFDEVNFWLWLPRSFSAIKVGKALAEIYQNQGKLIEIRLFSSGTDYSIVSVDELGQ